MSQAPRNLLIGLLFAATLALGAAQGRRVGHLRECEIFYRWMLSASNQVRLFGQPGYVPPGEDPAKFRDEELFERLVQSTETMLPDIPLDKLDYDSNGNPFPKIVRYSSVPRPEPDSEAAEPERGEIITEERLEREARLWKLAQDPALAPVRAEMAAAYRAGEMTSLGSQFGVAGMYDYENRSTTASLANMFFGFRKMAANLVWLEVDRFWHKGMMHRMIPLMHTCVALDPTFIDAYLLGAWHLAYNATAKLDDTPWELRTYKPQYEAWVGEKEALYFEAVDFLRDGIRKNPRNYKLYFDLGYATYENKLNDHVNAIKYLSEAVRVDHDKWVRRQLYRIQGLNEQFEESKAGWESYLRWQPDNVTAPRFIRLMEGRILERDLEHAGVSAKAAERLAKRAADRGDAAAAADWQAKAEQARDREKQLFQAAKEFWANEVERSGAQKDTFAEARMLRLEAIELAAKGQYVEANIALEQARWTSNELWNEMTDLMVRFKQESNTPLALTEKKAIQRHEEQLEYTRHLPRPIGGFVYRFDNGTWRREGYGGEETVKVREDSAEADLLQFEHPETARVLSELDGNIILRAGDTWFEYESNSTAKPSKLYTASA